jgi:hypothetical protein
MVTEALLASLTKFGSSTPRVENREPTCPAGENRATWAGVGEGLIVAGLVLAPIGWITFGISRGAKVNYLSAHDVQIALAPTRDGATFGITGRF